MTCTGKKFAQCTVAKDCTCYKAVMRTYASLADDKTIPDRIALEAAQRVYSFHRPDEDAHEAGVMVERWINEGHMQ